MLFDADPSCCTKSTTNLGRISSLDQGLTKGTGSLGWNKPARLARDNQIFGSLNGCSDDR